MTVLYVSYVLHSHVQPFLTKKDLGEQFHTMTDGTLAFRAGSPGSAPPPLRHGGTRSMSPDALSPASVPDDLPLTRARQRPQLTKSKGSVWLGRQSLIIASTAVAKNSISFVRPPLPPHRHRRSPHHQAVAHTSGDRACR